MIDKRANTERHFEVALCFFRGERFGSFLYLGISVIRT